MTSVSLSIPGKVMLAGEYSVLKGGHSLAVCIDKHLRITATLDQSLNHWVVKSNLWENEKIVRDQKINMLCPLTRAVQFASRNFALPGGTLTVDSDLNIQDGIGSSSAIRLGVCAAMEVLKHGRDLSLTQNIGRNVLEMAWTLQHEAQGQASGYDLVTQYLGGLVEFHADQTNDHWHPHWFRLPVDGLADFVHVFVGGAGTPTAPALQTTSQWLDNGNRSDKLSDISEAMVDAFVRQIRFPTVVSQRQLFATIADHRTFFMSSPLFPSEISSELAQCQGHDIVWSWKTTGAGGEDAILILGSLENAKPGMKLLLSRGWRRLDAKFSENGIRLTSTTDVPQQTPLKQKTFANTTKGASPT